MNEKIIYFPVIGYILSNFKKDSQNYPHVCPVVLNEDGYWDQTTKDYDPEFTPIGIIPALPETYEVVGIMTDETWTRLGFQYPGKKTVYNWEEKYTEALRNWEKTI